MHFKDCVKERGIQEDSRFAPEEMEGRVVVMVRGGGCGVHF